MTHLVLVFANPLFIFVFLALPKKHGNYDTLLKNLLQDIVFYSFKGSQATLTCGPSPKEKSSFGDFEIPRMFFQQKRQTHHVSGPFFDIMLHISTY